MINVWALPVNTPVSTTYQLTDKSTTIKGHELQRIIPNDPRNPRFQETAFDKIDIIRCSDRVKQVTLKMDFTRTMLTPTKFEVTGPSMIVGGYDFIGDGSGVILSTVEERSAIEWKTKIGKTTTSTIIDFKNMKPLAPGETQRFRLEMGQLSKMNAAQVFVVNEVDSSGQVLSRDYSEETHNIDWKIIDAKNYGRLFRETSWVTIDGHCIKPSCFSFCC